MNTVAPTLHNPPEMGDFFLKKSKIVLDKYYHFDDTYYVMMMMNKDQKET